MKKLHGLTLVLAVALIAGFVETNVHEACAINSISVLETVKTETKEEFVVTLDAGHGGYDAGSLSLDESLSEKDITLAITLKIGEYLTQQGIQVVYTRESDEVSWNANNLEDLQSRIDISNANKSELFVSIHLNSFITSNVSGFETWVDKNNEKAVLFAQLVQSNLDALDYSYNRGVKDVNLEPLYVINNNLVPSALLELGYITSQNDISYLSDATSQDNIAQSIAQAIVAYRNEKG